MSKRTKAGRRASFRRWANWIAWEAAVDYFLMLPEELRDDGPLVMIEAGIDLRLTSIECPTQVKGTVDGMGLYFRGRHGLWTCDIAPTVEDAVAGDTSVHREAGTDWIDGFMSRDDAWSLVRGVVEAWRATRGT